MQAPAQMGRRMARMGPHVRRCMLPRRTLCNAAASTVADAPSEVEIPVKAKSGVAAAFESMAYGPAPEASDTVEVHALCAKLGSMRRFSCDRRGWTPIAAPSGPSSTANGCTLRAARQVPAHAILYKHEDDFAATLIMLCTAAPSHNPANGKHLADVMQVRHLLPMCLHT